MKLTVLILTYNEALHIERCVQSAQRVADEVLVVDSYSCDDTAQRAHRAGARVLQNTWTNHAAQVNWALENGGIQSDWIIRVDADEVLDEELAHGLRQQLESAPVTTTGFEVNRRIRFMGSEIRGGGMAPLWILRIFRNGSARCEARWMDEHMVLSAGRAGRICGSLIDDNLKPLTWWTEKHNHYASLEAVDLLNQEYGLGWVDDVGANLNPQARAKRWAKRHVYGRLPVGVRPWLYFLYRMVMRLGILDGSSGITFHTLQGLWYRQLVDAKVREVKQAVTRGCDISEAVRVVLGIDLKQPLQVVSGHLR